MPPKPHPFPGSHPSHAPAPPRHACVIFRKAQNKSQDPAKLRRLIVDLIDKEQWSSLSADVKVDSVTRLCAMNLLLHGIGSEAYGQLSEDLPVVTKDALAGRGADVLCSPTYRTRYSPPPPRRCEFAFRAAFVPPDSARGTVFVAAAIRSARLWTSRR